MMELGRRSLALPDAFEGPLAVRPQASPDEALTPEEEAMLGEDVDLEPDFRRQVLLTFRTLNRLDHYALLGLDRTADRKVLKRSYFDLAAKFHPDRYFRKKLGSFKTRMESIFGRVTLAHDTLTDKERRAEYDAYLEEQRRSRGIEELLAEALAEAKRTEERIEREAREQERNEGRAAAPASPPAGPPAPAAPSPAVAAAARRDALARRLLGGRPPPTGTAPSGAPAPATRPTQGAQPGARPAGQAPLTASEAMNALRRRYEDRVSQAKAAQARKYIKIGDEALASGDAVAAANAFRVALTLSPENADLQRAAQDAQQRADAILAETYARQAGYEEKNGQFAEAARSWARVVKARPGDAAAHERAANAIVKSEGNLHEASRLAQQACALDPSSAPFRVTLANVYIGAGLTLSARRELETAAQLAPHDGTIQALLRRVGKP
jgi:curved DNA-binding protein CbpA